LEFMPAVNKRIYVTITEHVHKAIESGLLKPGDKLPSERDLALQFNSSRASVREALAALEVLGLVDCKPGIGNVIRENAKSIKAPSVARLAVQASPYEVYETRLMFEPSAAGLAAARCSNEDLESLGQLLRRMNGALEARDHKQFHSVDREFHAAIASLTGNELILQVLGEVFDQMRESLWMALKTHVLERGTMFDKYQASHVAIVECLKNHDSAGVRSLMEKHIREVGSDLFGEDDCD